MSGKTDYEKEGRAPILTEQFNTVVGYTFTTMSGQMSDVDGMRFIFRADPDNSGTVKIGGLGTMLFPMDAGFGLTMEVENLNQVYANVPAGDKLHVLVLNEV